MTDTKLSRLRWIPAERRATVQARISQLQDYLQVYEKLDETRRWVEELSIRRAELESELEVTESQTADAQRRIELLEEHFNAILERFHPPEFGQGKSRIDRRTFLPLFRGRRFDDLSSPGLATLVNIAHAIAHQRTNIELDLRLPNILFIDGLSEHLCIGIPNALFSPRAGPRSARGIRGHAACRALGGGHWAQGAGQSPTHNLC